MMLPMPWREADLHNAMYDFLKDIEPKKIVPLLSTKRGDYWRDAGNRRMLKLFHEAFERVPAYKAFLKDHGVKASAVRTMKDFARLPHVTKENYLRRYPLEALSWNGTLKKSAHVFTATSGSTGAAFYFPRDRALDLQSSISHELFLRNAQRGKRRSVLVIDGFGMGVWIGGLITYEAFHSIAERGNPVTIITPGSNKKEILEAMRHIARLFDDIVLCGYPPFIKDVIDEGVREGIDWSRYSMKLLFAAEGFSDRFRSYVATKAGIKNVFFDTMNIYGSADLGTMAQESPLTIATRAEAAEDKSCSSISSVR